MVDLETRKIIDMIESREMEDVAQWLSRFPNIKTVSRDGSLTYASAIAAAHPQAMQVSDRFHLIKNLCDHARSALYKVFQGRIAIPITSETKRIRMVMLVGTVAEKVQLVQKLRTDGHNKAEIILLTGASERTVKQYMAMRVADIPPEKQTVRGREHVGVCSFGTGGRDISLPTGLAADTAGKLYIAEMGGNKKRLMDPDTRLTDYAGAGEPSSARGPVGLLIHGGYLYVCDEFSGIVYRQALSGLWGPHRLSATF